MNDVMIKGISVLVTVLLGFGAAASGDSAKEPQGSGQYPSEKTVTEKIVDIVDRARPEREGAKASAELTDVNTAVSDASVKLFQGTVAKDVAVGKSVMVSPVSILSAMALTEAGAAGKTLEEMEKAFGCSREDLQQWMKGWTDALQVGKKTKCTAANSFWYRSSFTPKPTYLKTLDEIFAAEAYPSTFDSETVKAINDWCKNHTDGMIPKILEDLSPDQTAVLINAVAFDGKWKAPYEDYQVQDMKFTDEAGEQQKASMLCSTEARYIHDEKTTGFIKPYSDGYSFVAMLPKKGVTMEEYLKNFDGAAFRGLLASEQKADVYTRLPEFKLEYNAEAVKDTLKSMGIRQAFDGATADFSGMSDVSQGNLYIGSIIHKTYIEVNQKGTKAAAVTAVIVECTSAAIEQKYYEVYLDRPFLYAIIDDATGIPVFMGAVMGL